MRHSSIQRVEQAASLRDRIGKLLSAAITSGELAPGTLVSVPTLASQFDVFARGSLDPLALNPCGTRVSASSS